MSDIMNGLQVFNDTSDKTPIEVLLQVGEDNRVSSRNVFEFLGMSFANYARWCRTNIEMNQFAEDGADFTRSSLMMNGNETLDFRLSVPFAKKLCMLSKTERGEQARDYFVKVEDTLKEVARNLPQLTTNEMLLQIAQANVELEKQVLAVRQEVAQISGKTSDVEDIALDAAIKAEEAIAMAESAAQRPLPIDLEAEAVSTYYWGNIIRERINTMYPNIADRMRLLGRLYARLEAEERCDLTSRVTRKRKRMKKAGAKYTDCKTVTKLDVIADSQKLARRFVQLLDQEQEGKALKIVE